MQDVSPISLVSEQIHTKRKQNIKEKSHNLRLQKNKNIINRSNNNKKIKNN